MPLARISMIKGRDKATVHAIADGVHNALVAVYKVPLADRFQVIEQLDADSIIYSPDYLGIARTDGIVIVHVVAGHWRDDTAKRALYREICEQLTRHAGVRAEDVQVVITSNDKPDWSFGNGVASYLPVEENA
jgi:phenylpyruvate tautomerase PptA (4-oxalocrotonate tautomerase family)